MVSLDEATANAARLLTAAEGETDRGLAELYVRMAETWVSLSAVVAEQLA